MVTVANVAAWQRLTTESLAVLAVMYIESRPWYGLDLEQAARLKAGTIYPSLARLEHEGWVTSHWNDQPVPRRRVYELAKSSGSGW